MKRLLALVLSSFVLLAPAVSAHDELGLGLLEGAGAGIIAAPDGPDESGGGLSLLTRWGDPGPDGEDRYRQGSDLAFWGDLAVLGAYGNPAGFRLLDISDPASPSLVGQLSCAGGQGDVSIWDDVVLVSVDSPLESSECSVKTHSASTAAVAGDAHWEGLRVVSIADPTKPTQVAAVKTDCGSHTHTVVPDLEHADGPRLLVYVLSYPLGGQGSSCNAASHRKISIVEVPLGNPAAAKVIATPNVGTTIGCHDVTVLVEEELAAAACISESQLWDVSDPTDPQIVSVIRNPAMQIHHSSAFSWDGQTLVLGDEMGGAVAASGCLTGGSAPTGALWFYDISDREAPAPESSFVVERSRVSEFCTAHNFNVVPRDDRDVLVSAWYTGGTTVIDFTDPANPTELAHWIGGSHARSAAWSSYWYNGHVYVNNFDEDVNSLTARSRGLDVLTLDNDEAVGGAVPLLWMNPQTQERASWQTARAPARPGRVCEPRDPRRAPADRPAPAPCHA